jgi:predicted ATPase
MSPGATLPPVKTPTFEQLIRMWEAGQFEPQIHYIRFPQFRNLEPGLKVEFGCPITALVGANGTNKSSILRALQGSPDYENIGKYWFGTALDEIGPLDRHRFIHGRMSPSANMVVEVLKTRILRRAARPRPAMPSGANARDPDYFEPSRPLIQDGMTPMPPAPTPMPEDRVETRWKAIDKKVLYIDFRAELSAFDKYFYHNDYRSRPWAPSRARDPLLQRKELIRERSQRLKSMLDKKLSSYRAGGKKEWVLDPARTLSAAETAAVGEILGRQYASIEVVSHRAFDVAGTTARLRTTTLSYSEAWAGSGEFAAIQLVTAVNAAPDRSLVLLDEPEVSLHPGAQRRLLVYLMRQAYQKRLQVVFATHSPVMIEALPDVAIKVLEVAPSTNHVTLRSQRSSPSEAFVAIEHRFTKKTVMVEDALAGEIVLRALRGREPLVHTVEVRVQPGGASALRARYLPVWAANNARDVLLYLDGDQSLVPPMPSVGAIAPDSLHSEVERLLGVSDVSGHVPADSGGPREAQLRSLLAWSEEYVRYLPGNRPEEWLRNQLDGGSVAGDAKNWWERDTFTGLRKSGGESVTSEEIFNRQKTALAALSDENEGLLQIRAEIARFVDGSR